MQKDNVRNRVLDFTVRVVLMIVVIIIVVRVVGHGGDCQYRHMVYVSVVIMAAWLGAGCIRYLQAISEGVVLHVIE